jgi:hypothetical protein
VPPPVCPACSGLETTALESTNKTAEIDLHLCSTCNHLWATLKATGRLVAHVTPLMSPKKNRPRD